MRKAGFFLLCFLICFVHLRPETLTLYTGLASSKAQYVGASVGDDVFPFLNFHLDLHKYTKNDQSLYSAIPEENRGDFLGLSLNLALKFPIYLLPHLDRLELIEPYLLVGYGVGLENLNGNYMSLPDAEGHTGILSKLRQYHSLGTGMIVWITRVFGVKFDVRKINIKELEGMNYPARTSYRYSFGICFGGSTKKKTAPSK